MDPTPDGLDIAQIASDILESARARAGKAAVLARTLEQMGVVGEGGVRYSESAISNWIRRRARPPAEAVLAAAASQGISIDTRLGIASGDEETIDGVTLAERVSRLEGRLGSLLEVVGKLQEADQVQRQLLERLVHADDQARGAKAPATWGSAAEDVPIRPPTTKR